MMVVDDHEDSRELLAMLLVRQGYVTSTAGDGREALRLAAAQAPDIVILDIGLPDMDGYELARQLRALLSPAPVRLISLTGHGTALDRRRSRAAGIDVHLVKPINIGALMDVIEPA